LIDKKMQTPKVLRKISGSGNGTNGKSERVVNPSLWGKGSGGGYPWRKK